MLLLVQKYGTRIRTAVGSNLVEHSFKLAGSAMGHRFRKVMTAQRRDVVLGFDQIYIAMRRRYRYGSIFRFFGRFLRVIVQRRWFLVGRVGAARAIFFE